MKRDGHKTLPPEGELPAARQGPAEPPPSSPPTRESDPEPPPSPPPIRKSDRELSPSPLALERSPDAVPWLRLNLGGHVSPVRAIAFSPDAQRLFSGGEDKSVLVWRRALRNQKWQRERTIYWQIQRGAAGRIYAMAAGPGLLAIAGHGAMGGLGEILLIDPDTGNLKAALYDEQKGHRQVIVSLALSPDAHQPGLASIDRSGKTLYWSPNRKTGLWTAKVLVPTDRQRYGHRIADRLSLYRGTAPLVMLDASTVVLPEYTSETVAGPPQWQLVKIDVRRAEPQPLRAAAQAADHVGMVTALAVAPGGSNLASTDASGNLYLWDLGLGVIRHRLESPGVSLAYGPLGKTLAVGTAKTEAADAALQIWDIRNPRRPRILRQRAAADHVYSCAVSFDGELLAYSDGSDVVVEPLRRGGTRTRLQAPIRPPLRLAFPIERPFYRIAFGTQRNDDGTVPVERVFDTARVQLGRAAQMNQADWLPENWLSQGWEVRAIRQRQVETSWLFERDQRRARIPFDPSVQGAPSAWCWVPDRNGRPYAVAIGTNGNNNIYLFRLTTEGTCPILRVFRGHAGAVTSLAISRDLRYLASGSQDATVRIWPLRQLDDGSVLLNRWGANLRAEGGQLIVHSIREDGPLYFRGVRAGDQLTRLRWVDAKGDGGNIKYEQAERAEKMLQVLGDVPWDTMVAFEYLRGRAPGRRFQMFPAWQQLVSLVVAENRQWAYWAPSGFYDASFEGHKLFGWQVNRGLTTLPDFFLAAQLRKALERPDVMSRLLEAGSIEEAFRLAKLEVPANPHRAVVNAYRLKPDVEILSPVPGEKVPGTEVEVVAAIQVRDGQQLMSPKAFANGVVAVGRQLLRSEPVTGGKRFVYRWKLQLPSDPRVMIQVIAATDTEVVDIKRVMIERAEVPSERQPRVFIATAGVNQYRDSQLPRLDFAVRNATQVAMAMKENSFPLYRAQSVSLLDQNVTRPTWTVTMRHYASRLRQRVSADDLLVVFLSGHGVRDPETNEYYFVTANARYSDIKSRRYVDCMSFEDFALFSDIPCRKLVILDTCHSGAVQPLRQRELKAALRSLQQDLVFTLTATEGGQDAAEAKQRQLGRFTNRLLEGLRGAADAQSGNRDGTVSWSELARFVKRTVTMDSATDQQSQFPTAGPIELLNVADFPLTVADTPVTTASAWP